MPNPHPVCERPGCRRRHRPGPCGPEGGKGLTKPAEVIQCHSLPKIIVDLARICGDLAVLVGKLPCMTTEKQEFTTGKNIIRGHCTV